MARSTPKIRFLDMVGAARAALLGPLLESLEKAEDGTGRTKNNTNQPTTSMLYLVIVWLSWMMLAVKLPLLLYVLNASLVKQESAMEKANNARRGVRCQLIRECQVSDQVPHDAPKLFPEEKKLAR